MRPPIRRSKFRYSKCAWQTFIYGGMTTCGRMKVTVKVHRRLGGLSSGIPSAPGRLLFMVVRPLVGA